MTHNPARRAAVVACTAVLAVLGLAACGDSEPTTEAAERPTVNEAPETTEAPEPETTEAPQDEERKTTAAAEEPVEVDVDVDVDIETPDVDVETPAPAPAPAPPPPAPAPARDNLQIPAGMIEDGHHYGYLTMVGPNYIDFDRATPIPGDGWENNKTTVRRLPFVSDWEGGYPTELPWPVEIYVSGQYLEYVMPLDWSVTFMNEDLTVGGAAAPPDVEEEVLEPPLPADMGTCDEEGALHPDSPEGLIVCIDGIWQWSS